MPKKDNKQYEMGYHNKRMFKDGFFNPDLKNYNFATGCPEPIKTQSKTAIMREVYISPNKR